MTKRVFSVGFDIPNPDVESVQFKSNGSILDADIVIFSPTLDNYSPDDEYAGQPLLSQWDSNQLRQHTQHWRSELTIALEHGKNVFLFLEEISDHYMHSGERKISSSGRAVTNLVHPYEPYSSLL